jgi:hypothetical protein
MVADPVGGVQLAPTLCDGFSGTRLSSAWQTQTSDRETTRS